uniref:CCHC-type domain-containing protein n=1 Tax=Anopheles atroparvus TaxID=41427 RepID=A0AAG5DQW2_ANOAO
MVKGFLLDKQTRVESTRPSANSTMQHTFTSSSQMRLPKIELPAFSGDHTQWISFKDRFTAMVHDVSDLSDTVKLQYLLASLKGEAATLFEHVQLIEGNYASTWDALLKRFDDTKTLKREYFKALVDLDGMTGPTPEELTRIVNESRRLVRGMGRLKEPVASWNTPLSSLVRYKLDVETLMAYELATSDVQEDTFETLMEFCERRIKILTNSVVNKANRIETRQAIESRNPRKEQASPRKTCMQTQRQYPTSTLACAAQTPRRPPRGCEVCHADHTLTKCPSFEKMTTQDRQRVVKEEALCFNCLGKGHQARFCRVGRSCGRCRGRHHTLVCTQDTKVAQARNEGNITATTQVEVAKQGLVWLSTAQVLVCNEDGVELPARALLDQ